MSDYLPLRQSEHLHELDELTQSLDIDDKLEQAQGTTLASCFHGSRVWRDMSFGKRSGVGLAMMVGLFLLALRLTGLWRVTGSSLFDDVCNPFEQFGYLHFNQTHPGDNTWRPYSKTCPPSALYGDLFRNLQNFNRTGILEEPEDFSWMRNRTVVMIGDSVDRYLMIDFCWTLQSRELSGEEQERPFQPSDSPQTPRFYQIRTNSSLSPPMFYYDGVNWNSLPEDWPRERTGDFLRLAPLWAGANRERTGPKICHLPSHDFMIIHMSTWGLSPSKGGAHFTDDGGFHPPHKLIDRIDHILVPVLQRIATHFNRPKTMVPDIVQLCSGFWDLWDWSAEDFKAKGEKPDPASNTIFSELSDTRLGRWKNDLVKTFEHLAKVFPTQSTTLMWRTFSRPSERHWHVPFSRLNQLDELAQQVLQDLNTNNTLVGPRLRINRWGHRVRGQEWNMRDKLHPNPLPAGVLWADIILWELRRMARIEGIASR